MFKKHKIQERGAAQRSILFTTNRKPLTSQSHQCFNLLRS